MDEIIGWVGMVLIVCAYASVSFNILDPQSSSYQIMNLVGALGIVYISFKRRAYPPGVLNIIWALIALVAIIRILS